MKLYLAPMEGVIDHHMRNILTRIGGYDHCVTEFVRITDQLLPPVVFHRICPELATASQTSAGTPVTLQLLGGTPNVMAENAQRAAELGAAAIDINFGCPSRFTNSKAGGAVLLKEPERIFHITAAVRRALPKTLTVSAKIRLGYENTDLALDNALAVEAANASFITVHARTRVDGYNHPARWEWLGRINEALSIPLVANGDINSVGDFLRCREISGCEDFMLGRGAVIQPDLARQISATQSHTAPILMKWRNVVGLIIEMADHLQRQPNIEQKKVLGRIKQWLVYLRQRYPEAETLFTEIRQIKQLAKADELLRLSADA
ncbi:MAG TPA: tRNA dihydrouridine(16) synthase DusC [Chromatiales bacterium]|nr:tRNA dihydrouridine(16) synthase DusC [Chromatiales bacterium]